MSQTHGVLRHDAAKKRRAYLRKKLQANASAALAIGICAACIAYLWSPIQSPHYERNIPPDPNRAAYLSTVITNGFYFLGPKWPAYCGTAILTLVSLLVVIVVTGVHCVKQVRSAVLVAYVPPVAEQLAALSAKDILLRATEKPAAVSGELLMAARAGAETEAEELLRASKTN